MSKEIKFKNEGLPYTIKAISEKYAICTRPFDKEEDDDLVKHSVEMSAYLTKEEAREAFKNEVIYTILDFRKNKRSTHNLILNPYDFKDQKDIDKCLEDLDSGEIELSRRNAVELITL